MEIFHRCWIFVWVALLSPLTLILICPQYCAEKPDEVPDFVFLAHCIDVLSSLQVSFCFRTAAAHPYTCHWFLWPLWPLTLSFLFVFWIVADVFVAHKYYLNKLKCMAWIVPCHGFQVPILPCDQWYCLWPNDAIQRTKCHLMPWIVRISVVWTQAT